MNTFTNFQSNNNNFHNFDQNFNQPNYESNFGIPYSPINPYGQETPMPPPVYPNQGIIPSMMPITPRPTTSVATRPTTKAPVYSRPPSTPSSNDAKTVCGTRFSESEITPLVFGGEDTQRGDWPWMVCNTIICILVFKTMVSYFQVAIYLNKPTGLSFNCGGTLISSKTVITAAHCINTSTKNYRAREVVLYLGRYSLIDWSEVGAIATNVEEIVIHKDYKRQRESFDADIAILLMTKRVEFNEFVRPACLWPGESSIQEIEGKSGTVVGWGKDGTDRVVSNIPKKVDLPIVNSITCVQTSESLSKAVSNRTFCAGTLNGDGPCHGDSGDTNPRINLLLFAFDKYSFTILLNMNVVAGGGLTLYHENRWVLRGIVSAGLSDANTGSCKLMDYVVFTDVTYFTSWIMTNGQFWLNRFW